MLTPKDKQDARMALLRYYSSKCVAHGAYIVAIAVGFLGLVEATPFILDFAGSVSLPLSPEPLTPELTRGIILSLMASWFLVSMIYILGRTIFWGYLTVAILNVKPKKENEVESEREGTTITFLQQLHVACFDYVERKHKIWTKFYVLRAGDLAFIWFDLFVVFLVTSLILLYVP